MPKKNANSAAAAPETPTVTITPVEFTAGQRKSDYARSLITANLPALKGENSDAVRGAVVSALCQATGMARALARVYIKENITRVERRAAAAAEQALHRHQGRRVHARPRGADRWT